LRRQAAQFFLPSTPSPSIATAGLGLDTTATAVPNPDFFVDCNTLIFTRK
jgi:hypothetical protein